MYFSKVQLVPGHAEAFDPYREHQLLWQLFTDRQSGSERFLYRRLDHPTVVSYLLVSTQQPLTDVAELTVQTKPYAPKLISGQQFAFNLRVNPVVSKRDEQGKQSRHDVVMDLKHRSRQSNNRKSQAELERESGLEWLLPRLEKAGGVANKANIVIDGYRQHRLRKRSQRQPIRFSSMDFSGQLTVTDPASLERALCQGIGPAKGFGCGLLLIRPVGR